MKNRIVHTKHPKWLNEEREKLERERFYARHYTWVLFCLTVLMMTMNFYQGQWL